MMSVEKAIEDIQINIKPVVGGVSLDMAIWALKKRLPYEPRRKYQDGTVMCGYCESLTSARYTYCPCCGQKFK